MRPLLWEETERPCYFLTGEPKFWSCSGDVNVWTSDGDALERSGMEGHGLRCRLEVFLVAIHCTTYCYWTQRFCFCTFQSNFISNLLSYEPFPTTRLQPPHPKQHQALIGRGEALVLYQKATTPPLAPPPIKLDSLHPLSVSWGLNCPEEMPMSGCLTFYNRQIRYI